VPVEFLSDEQAAAYGRFLGPPSQEQLERFFWLNDTDLVRVGERRQEATALGYAVQLGTVRFLGTFLPGLAEVPPAVVSFVAAQLGIDPASIEDYGARAKTAYDHQWAIRRDYGYRDFSEHAGELRRFVEARAWMTGEGPAHHAGSGWSAIACQLNEEEVPTAHGGAKWHPSTVRAVVMRSET